MQQKRHKFLLQVIVFAGNTSFLDGNVDNGFRKCRPIPRNHAERIAMPSTPTAIVLVVASTVAAFAAIPCRAIESGSAAKARQLETSAFKRDMRKAGKAQAGKSRRNDKDAQRQIVTYNLFQDPVFKLNGALADKRQLGVPHAADRGSLAPRGAPLPSASPALKLPEPESAGIDFGCRDKPFRSRSKAPELTACYKHNVDRSWKTQTYVSREVNADGTQKWGGGLAVRYAY
jgi:hypothetical protein